MSNKAIIIAASMFVTLIIASGVLMVFDQIRKVYLQVYTTNISITNEFDEFDAYNNTTKTKADILNTAKKYRNKHNIDVKFMGSSINNDSSINNFTTTNFDNLGNLKNENSIFKSTVNKISNKIVIEFNH